MNKKPWWMPTREQIAWWSFVAGLYTFVLAITTFDAPAVALVDMFLAGWNLAGAFYNLMSLWADANFKRLVKVCDDQQQMLQALIENRVQVHIEGMFEEPPPTAPRLH